VGTERYDGNRSIGAGQAWAVTSPNVFPFSGLSQHWLMRSATGSKKVKHDDEVNSAQ
jgi:hypothetical protein